MYDYPVYLVTWLDAHDISGWNTVSEILCEPTIVCSLGYLIKESSTAIVLAQTVDKHGLYNNAIVIPIVNIQERKELIMPCGKSGYKKHRAPSPKPKKK